MRIHIQSGGSAVSGPFTVRRRADYRGPLIRRGMAAALVAAVVVAVSGCAGTSPGTSATDPSSPATASASPSAAALTYVAFGDSWPEGAHCDGCTAFPELWAEAIRAQTGRVVTFTDLTGQGEGGPEESKTSASLLDSLRMNESNRAAVRGADIILIATGPNEIGPVQVSLRAGTCGGPDGAECIRALGRTWRNNFDAILAEINALREGRPTAVRLVSAGNPFLSEPEMNEGMPAGFATNQGALMFEQLTTAMCESASAHGAGCVDVRPILNGPKMDQSVDENSPQSMQAVSDALARTGLPELS